MNKQSPTHTSLYTDQKDPKGSLHQACKCRVAWPTQLVVVPLLPSEMKRVRCIGGASKNGNTHKSKKSIVYAIMKL